MRERLQLDDNISESNALEHFRFDCLDIVSKHIVKLIIIQKRFQHKPSGVIQSDCQLVGSYNEAALSEKYLNTITGNRIKF